LKRIIPILLAVVLLSASTAISFAADNTSNSKVIVYYFHGNFRCSSCWAIERYTKEVLNNNFKKRLDSGQLVIKVVNVEKEGNTHFVQDYQLYTKSVVLSLVKDGKEVKFKNLDKVWQYLRNKNEFYEYIKEETQSFLDVLKAGDEL